MFLVSYQHLFLLMNTFHYIDFYGVWKYVYLFIPLSLMKSSSICLLIPKSGCRLYLGLEWAHITYPKELDGRCPRPIKIIVVINFGIYLNLFFKIQTSLVNMYRIQDIYRMYNIILKIFGKSIWSNYFTQHLSNWTSVCWEQSFDI